MDIWTLLKLNAFFLRGGKCQYDEGRGQRARPSPQQHSELLFHSSLYRVFLEHSHLLPLKISYLESKIFTLQPYDSRFYRSIGFSTFSLGFTLPIRTSDDIYVVLPRPVNPQPRVEPLPKRREPCRRDEST